MSWLPTHRLLHADPGGRDGATGVVLVLCGSFSPPTIAHLHIIGMGKAAVERLGAPFAGAFISPVHDGYGKRGLAPAKHRLAMCELAAASKATGLPGIESAQADYRLSACGWEASQPELTRTLRVLQSYQAELDAHLAGVGDAPHKFAKYRAMLVCGEDLLMSILTPGAWREDLVRQILSAEFGVVCAARRPAGSAKPPLEASVAGSPLLAASPELREHIVLSDPVDVPDAPDVSDVSSTRVRGMWQVATAEPAARAELETLTPREVVEYALVHELF